MHQMWVKASLPPSFYPGAHAEQACWECLPGLWGRYPGEECSLTLWGFNFKRWRELHTWLGSWWDGGGRCWGWGRCCWWGCGLHFCFHLRQLNLWLWWLLLLLLLLLLLGQAADKFFMLCLEALDLLLESQLHRLHH